MDTTEIKKKLLELKQGFEKRIEKTQQHIRHVDGPVEQDFEEQVVTRKNDDVIYNLDSLARSELMQINSALRRIDQGVYGVCTHCGENIDPERLKVLPYTDHCRDCGVG
ncbi:MAG: TraR/DksA family transcriptional regulator [Gammaproteobacteria bacterium]